MNVLVVDDDRMVLHTLSRFVEVRADTPFPAPDGRTALEVFATHEIDLVITDVQMPDLTGIDVLKAVRRRKPEVPVIVVTGHTEMSTAVEAVNQGAFAFLQKPITFAELNAKIEEAVRKVQSRRQVEEQIQTLERTARDHQRRLAQVSAFSTAVLENIPFPVCLIDRDGEIQMVNPAFHGQMVDGDEPAVNRRLEEVVPGLDLGPFGSQGVFERFQDEARAADVTTSMAGSADGRTRPRYFRVTGFPIASVEGPEQKKSGPTVCLFMQDVTLQVELEQAAEERQWYLREVSVFRELTESLITSAEFMERVVAHLAEVLSEFNPVRVELKREGKTFAAGIAGTGDPPYIAGCIWIGKREGGQISLFSPAPVRGGIQQTFMEEVVEILGRRIEIHEVQMGVVQSERLRALGEMAAGVAHELNQPLTGIRTFAEGLLYGLKNGWETSDEELAETMTDIVNQVDRASGIIDYMRSFSRNSARTDFVPFRISGVVENVFKLVGAQLRVHGIQVCQEIPEGLPECRGRPQQIEQVLLNLISNARQAMDTRARQVRAEAEPGQPAWKPRLEIAAHTEGEQVFLSVSDTGGGIPENILDRIFEPFFTSKGVGEGTGLGLSISRGIAREHGGDLQVINRLGEGATFELSLRTKATEDAGEQTG